VKLYVGREIVKTWDVPKGEAVERFHATYDIQVPHDTYVIVRVEGDTPLTPIVGGGKNIAVTPLALSNPIFLDTNGNGKYDAPNAHGDHLKGATETEEDKQNEKKPDLEPHKLLPGETPD
jgi:hypothetical protein